MVRILTTNVSHQRWFAGSTSASRRRTWLERSENVCAADTSPKFVCFTPPAVVSVYPGLCSSSPQSFCRGGWGHVPEISYVGLPEPALTPRT